jgi:hypothetical protein
LLSALRQPALLKLFFWLVRCASTASTSLKFQYSQTKPRFHRPLFARCDSEIHRHQCGIALNK